MFFATDRNGHMVQIDSCPTDSLSDAINVNFKSSSQDSEEDGVNIAKGDEPITVRIDKAKLDTIAAKNGWEHVNVQEVAYELTYEGEHHAKQYRESVSARY